MLKVYGHPLSGNARRVLIALLEKEIEFELILMKLDGDQFESAFSKLNLFNQIPVLIDEDFTVIESLAILDYLEAKYSIPALMPTDAKAIAKVRTIELVTVNELQSSTLPFMRQVMGLQVDSNQLEQAQKQIAKVLDFFEHNFSENALFFVDKQFSLADIVAGITVSSFSLLNISLEPYPKVKFWCEELQKRESWQQTTPTPEQLEAARPRIKEILQRRT
ncbi:MAG: glutathione S-transferase family protein [Xenococcaceae cyanobacterium]